MSSREERLRELLCDAALGPLGPDEEAERVALLREAGAVGAAEEHAIDVAAAAIALASLPRVREPLAAELVARLERQALEAVGPAPSAGTAPVVSVARGPRRSSVVVAWLAAAACFALAVGSMLRAPREVVVTRTVEVPVPASASPAPGPPPAPSSALARRDLLARQGTEQAPWSATKEAVAKGAEGDIVWNQAEQRGFMRFHGLSKNDPRVSQYQLWIFDGTRDARYPVDGGVFDVDEATGDVIVPIRARLPVGEPSLFAVTVEKPGGVVVSNRAHIVLTAKTRA